MKLHLARDKKVGCIKLTPEEQTDDAGERGWIQGTSVCVCGGRLAIHCESGEMGFTDSDRCKCVDSVLPL